MTFDDKAVSQEGTDNSLQQQQQQQQQRPQRHGIRRSLLEVFDAPPSAEKGAGGGLEEDPGRRLLSLMRDMFDSRTARAWLRYVGVPSSVAVRDRAAAKKHSHMRKRRTLWRKLIKMSYET